VFAETAVFCSAVGLGCWLVVGFAQAGKAVSDRFLFANLIGWLVVAHNFSFLEDAVSPSCFNNYQQAV
jgi:hypothetical protein